jgi:lysophospholipase L1-like esterase
VDVLPRLAALAAGLLLVGCSSSGGDGDTAARPSARPTPSAPPTASAAPSSPVDPTYLALGDSVAAGTGAGTPERGYVPVLAGLLADRLGCDAGSADGCPVEVRNLAVPGATTETLLRDQLPPALEELRQHDDVRVVTVTVGGNDVFVPILQACARTPQAPACAEAVVAAVGQVDQGVDRLLAELAGARGPATTVAVMTYYDPLPSCRLAALQPLAEQVLEGRGAQDGLNDVLRARAAQHGAVVVEPGPRLTAPQDFVGGLDCLHPSASGHARIAEAFLDAVAP